MSDQVKVMKGAESYSAAGDRRGALILHGFTGCPQSMRPLAETFATAGFSVELPRLPGHGTTPEDMAETDWGNWAAAVENAYRDLSARTDSIVVGGLSMGGSLTLWLAERHPEIAGIVLVNPAVEPDDFGDFVAGAQGVIDAGGVFLPGVAGDIADPSAKELGYDRSPAKSLLSLINGLEALKPKLANIKVPTLLLHSKQDHIIPPGSAALVRDKLGKSVEYVALEKSFHVATIDYDGAEINRRAIDFGTRVSRR
ncbi:alpha/beta fold hydrolase [Ferrovibrio terrae]|uniref:Alpha/beta fold hydrolase n=1 Tax=Ferrovibrio terrae TaxID=2594003 RepID=A0A516GY08_9PROT|nr:alpha/beta fold hydrolase [Ferrovibrio terrae]QDO96375.1 alpha/beta fold hydrolase [Ferrovibrio terrae]